MHPPALRPEIVGIEYTNYKGERSARRIWPARLEFTATKWHPESQWILVAIDIDKGAERGFAVRDIHSWGEPGQRPTADRDEIDRILRQRFMRSAPIEEQLMLAGMGKRPLPSAEECLEWAKRLGVPDDARAFLATPAPTRQETHPVHDGRLDPATAQALLAK